MPQPCCAFGCTNRKTKDSQKQFFRIPADPDQRQRWIAAINRDNWSPTEYSRLCSDHFIEGNLSVVVLCRYTVLFVDKWCLLNSMHVGKPSKDSRHPDYAPSVFHHKNTKSSSSSSLAHFERATSWAKRQSTSDDASSQAKKLNHLICVWITSLLMRGQVREHSQTSPLSLRS